MANPYSPYLVYGNVTTSLGYSAVSAKIEITTQLGTMSCDTDSNGNFVKDLADVGYSSGETVVVSTQDKFNNESSSDTFVVSGSYQEVNISLSVRTNAQETTGYTIRSMIHSIGNSPISKDNPLAVMDFSSLIPARYDSMELSYTGSNLTSVIYKSDGLTITTLTLSYDGSDNLIKVERS